MNTQYPNLPYVGQIVDYYPNNHTRLAAIVTEVEASSDIYSRPKVNLTVFNPESASDLFVDVEPVDEQKARVDPQDVELADRWGFQHEFFLAINEAEQDVNTVPKGTACNLHVGMLDSARIGL